MQTCLITFRSITPAQRGEVLLRKKGFYCALQRTPRWMEAQGCGYSLRIHHADAPECVRLLREAGVSFRKIYLQRDGSRPEEIIL